MDNIFIKCDRCKEIIFGGISKDFTAGYYTYDCWFAFMNPGEQYICDNCMFSDERYIKVYGRFN